MKNIFWENVEPTPINKKLWPHIWLPREIILIAPTRLSFPNYYLNLAIISNFRSYRKATHFNHIEP